MKYRNLVVVDEAAAKNALLSSNYYNIINGYSKYFPMQDDKYTGGTTFDEVTQLCLFDGEIKQAFFRAILAAESHLKSIFAYRFAERFQDIPYPYLNTSCYDAGKTLEAVATIHKLSGIINRHKKERRSSICHYLEKYNHVPIWVLVNYLDFGDLRHMLLNSQTQIQNNVAKDLLGFITQHIQMPGIFPPETMLAFLKNVNEARNICAHNNRLIGFRCHADDKYWKPLHQLYNISPDDSRRDIYSIYLALQCFLNKAEYNILHDTLRKKMNHFSNHLHSITLNDILKELGFPGEWNRSEPRIIQ
ncbi:Abi family protein [Selenomonas sp. TAMA-11512]|uniref:Abi family protein n=1 Tax=Selenomonas sp. TAMA-11512 TaxID=3095337 RepID=UPI003087A330|nr:Abi family protein [Selenomonas sp. TAMA-11512]